MKKLILLTFSLAFTTGFISLNPLWAIANPENVSASHYPVTAIPAGPTGPTGATGAAGATGSAGTPAIIDYAMISTDSTAALPLTSPAPITFDIAGLFAPSSTFSFSSPSTNLTINSTGVYLARYIVSSMCMALSNISFGLFLNGTLITGSDKSAHGAQAIYVVTGEAIFQVSSAPSILTVQALPPGGGNPIILGAEPDATNTASLTIQKLSD